MWHVWIAFTLVTCALGEETTASSVTAIEPQTTSRTTTREPPRTLDRQAEELAWKTWLRSQENGNPNTPPRRLITKSLFITPLICPKGQRFDRDGCVQVVTLNRDEHERYLLDQLNALLPPPSDDDELYDYGDEEPGPYQLSIPIGLDLQAAPLQGQESLAPAQEIISTQIELDKKIEKPANTDLSIEAELELLKLATNQENQNYTATYEHKVNDNFLPYIEKPKRDSTNVNVTIDKIPKNDTDEGQKEVVFGDVSIDPMLYITENQNKKTNETTPPVTEPNYNNETEIIEDKSTTPIQKNNDTQVIENVTIKSNITIPENNASDTHELKDNKEKFKLNPETDSANIGEAIKLISRYAEVTTDDTYAKDQKKNVPVEEGILGTRTKLQHRRNKLKQVAVKESPQQIQPTNQNERLLLHKYNPRNDIYYRYPWGGQNSPTPPPDYPFRHLQDYWPGRKHIGGIYNTGRENPRRHHHSYPHNTLRPRTYTDYYDYPTQYSGQLYPGQQQGYPPHRLVQRRVNPSPARGHGNRDLYSLLGLRHWFSTDSAAKR